MNEFIREFYNSEQCESSRYRKLSDDINAEYEKRDKIYRKLEENLDEENFRLFEEFADISAFIGSEEMFHNYCCGMRDLMRFTVGIFVNT